MAKATKTNKRPSKAPKSWPTSQSNVSPIESANGKVRRSPEQTLKNVPIAPPVTSPAIKSFWLHEAQNFNPEVHETITPAMLGNLLGEFPTFKHASEYPRRHNLYGYFGIQAHRVNGTLGKPTVIQNTEPEEVEIEADIDSDTEGEGFDLADLDDGPELLTPAEVKLRLENERLKATLQAKNGHGHGGILETIEAFKALNAMQAKTDIRDEIEKYQIIQSLTHPQREQSKDLTEEQALAKLLISQDDARDKIFKSLRGLLRNDGGSTETTVYDLIKVGIEAMPAIMQTAREMVADIINVRSQGGPQSVQPVQSSVTATSGPQPVHLPTSKTVQNTLNGSQAHQTGNTPENAYQAILTTLFQGLANNSPAEEMVKQIEAFLILNPQFEELLLTTLSPDPKELVGQIGQVPGAQHLANLPHAEAWIANLQSKLFRDDDGEAQDGKVKT